ncbi:MAG: hypothetical protein LPK88_06100 [Alphaproteobacteria bacterium]|nr:hypothetical protein [Alphaproteobacteria bacterium]MDX5415877.1 hypothetical protein [Alphaproteobacteria bacterium]MDX5493162.1 hypothetical protein [Alphaproteobacteria bacterium]
MSNTTQVNLATVGSDELKAMPIAVFNSYLDQMSNEAIARFKRMRKLSEAQKAAVERALSEPEGKRKSRKGSDAAPAAGSKGAAGAKGDRAEDAAPKGPQQATLLKDLLLRLIAWWDGVDTDALARSRGIKRWKRKQKPAKAVPAEAAEPEMPPLTRIDLLQKLWGEGFSLPGGADFALRIAGAEKIANGARCLDLAPGLGGGMRAVARAANARFTGIESDRELALAAADLSQASGLGDIAAIRPASFEGLGAEDFASEGGYAAVFMREAFFAVEGRDEMLAAIHNGLQENGSLLLTDFVIDSNPDRPISQAVAHWRAAEPDGADPWTEAEYRKALEDRHYIVERFDNITAKYLPLVKEGLRRFHDCLQNAKLPPETVPILMREGSLWLARSQALESGHLSIALIHARRAAPSGDDAIEEQPAAFEEAASEDDDFEMEQGRED